LDLEPDPTTELGPAPELPVEKNPSLLEQVRSGLAYQAKRQTAAEKLLEEDAYDAACSDAHKPQDIDEVKRTEEGLRRANVEAEG